MARSRTSGSSGGVIVGPRGGRYVEHNGTKVYLKSGETEAQARSRADAGAPKTVTRPSPNPSANYGKALADAKEKRFGATNSGVGSLYHAQNASIAAKDFSRSMHQNDPLAHQRAARLHKEAENSHVAALKMAAPGSPQAKEHQTAIQEHQDRAAKHAQAAVDTSAAGLTKEKIVTSSRATSAAESIGTAYAHQRAAEEHRRLMRDHEKNGRTAEAKEAKDFADYHEKTAISLDPKTEASIKADKASEHARALSHQVSASYSSQGGPPPALVAKAAAAHRAAAEAHRNTSDEYNQAQSGAHDVVARRLESIIN